MPAQQKFLREYARTKGINVSEEFVDVETAKCSGRTEFVRMLRTLEKSKAVRIILVEKTDRLYRNFRDQVSVDDLMKTHGVEVHFVKENTILCKDSRSHDKFIHDIKLVLAKNYIDNLSEEVQKGMREKAEQGEWPGTAPLGYVNDRIEKVIRVDGERAPLIIRLFEAFAAGGYSLVTVRDELHRLGLRTRKGNRLSKSTVEVILKNRFYCGEFMFKGKYYQGAHPPLITRDLFNRVNHQLSRGLKQKTRKSEFIFAGMVTCAKCGCLITGQVQSGKYVYYHCAQGKGKCHQPYVRQENMDEQFARLLKDITIDTDVRDWIVEGLKSSQCDEKATREDELQRLTSAYNKTQARLDQIYTDKLEGLIAAEQYTRFQEKLRLDQDSYSEQINRIRDANRNYTDTAIRILELAEKAYSLYVTQDPTEKRKLLRLVLSKSTLDNGTLSVTYNKPFDLILNGLSGREKLPQADVSRTFIDLILYWCTAA